MKEIIKMYLRSPTTNTMGILFILGFTILFFDNLRNIGVGVLVTLVSILSAAIGEEKVKGDAGKSV